MRLLNTSWLLLVMRYTCSVTPNQILEMGLTELVLFWQSSYS